MGRAHSRALYVLRTQEDAPAALPELHTVCGRDSGRLAAMRSRYGWAHLTTDWHQLVTNPDVALFVNAASNDLHAEPIRAALASGKHVLCEKPLGRNSAETRRMLAEARAAGVVHMCAFNYRFFPAIRLARHLIQSGEIGDVRHFRSRFLLGTAEIEDQRETPWRLQRESSGSGVIGDLLAHHIDLARYLVGEPVSVGASARTWQPERAGVRVDVEDSVTCVVEFDNGALGTLEASRAVPGHVLDSVIEVDGSRGSVGFDVRQTNELVLGRPTGRTAISVTQREHPFSELWWPPGHGVGWGDSFVHELRHFLGAAAGTWTVDPHGATFEDGHRCAQVCDALIDAARSGRRESVEPL
jgi:predicted dehydrogenase